MNENGLLSVFLTVSSVERVFLSRVICKQLQNVKLEVLSCITSDQKNLHCNYERAKGIA